MDYEFEVNRMIDPCLLNVNTGVRKLSVISEYQDNSDGFLPNWHTCFGVLWHNHQYIKRNTN